MNFFDYMLIGIAIFSINSIAEGIIEIIIDLRGMNNGNYK